jgi:starch synthase
MFSIRVSDRSDNHGFVVEVGQSSRSACSDNSVYVDHFQDSLHADFAKKAIMSGMTAEQTEMYSKATNTALNLGAISYSDAVVFASENINEEVLKFVKKGNKPTLEFNSTSDYENYYNLYEEIVSEELFSMI